MIYVGLRTSPPSASMIPFEARRRGEIGCAYVLKVLLVVVSVESAIARDRDVKAAAGSV